MPNKFTVLFFSFVLSFVAHAALPSLFCDTSWASYPNDDSLRLTVDGRITGAVSLMESDDTLFSRGVLGGAFTFGRFVLVNRVQADLTDRKPRFDHLNRTFKGSVPADVPYAFVAYRGDHFGALAGRISLRSGPGRSGSLLLGDYQPSLNGLSLWADWGFLKGYALSAKLQKTDADTNRWYSMMRVECQLHKRLKLGFNQSVVYAGLARGFEPGYVFPAFLYYFSQFGFAKTNEEDNLFLGADGEWSLNDLRVYGEFLADDFQVDDDSVSAGVQNAIAFLMGAELKEKGNRPAIGVELVRLNSYVYKHMGGLSTSAMANDHGGLLGHPLGADAEALYVWLEKKTAPWLTVTAQASYERRGDLNAIHLPWDAYDKVHEAVPHGTIDKRFRGLMGAKLKPFQGGYLETAVGWETFYHPRPFSSRGNGPLLRLEGGYHFSLKKSWKERASLLE